MKIVSIVSSYRRNGNTERVVKLIEEQISLVAKKVNVPVELERIFLAHSNIQTCQGCRACFDRGEEKCPLKDELLPIRDEMLKADGIILASPVYVEDINGIMKNWIDRMAFNNHRPAFAGKAAVIITTSGIGSTNHALKTMNSALHAWGFHIVGQSKFRTGALMETDEIKALYFNKIKRITNEFFSTIKNGKASKPTFYSLVVFKVQQKYWQKAVKSNTIDYIYWNNKGWLEPCCEFYTACKASRVKVKLARLVGSIIAVFFT